MHLEINNMSGRLIYIYMLSFGLHKVECSYSVHGFKTSNKNFINYNGTIIIAIAPSVH